MTVHLQNAPAGAVPIHLTDRAGLDAALARASESTRRWLKTVGFDGAPDSHALLADNRGQLKAVWAGVSHARHPWALAALPLRLPEADYTLAPGALALEPEAAAFSWQLGGYQFDRYKPAKRQAARLWLSPGPAAKRGLMLAAEVSRVRNLVNTPAEHMGPGHLAQAVQTLAKVHGARVKQTVGDALLKANFPAVHAVGRAAGDSGERAPRLIELTWGRAGHPRLTLVGKGVCFDSGGLDIKGADGMRNMKKDMGGAATALGLAAAIMALKLPVRLQLLIPAVENAIAGNAYRPGDVIRTRQGLHIEIGNTDAEGRVILCDALAYAAEGKPDLVIDLATLTGAARVALGGQLPALFCRDITQARSLVDLGLQLQDPLWHMPLWRDYHPGIESEIADIVNTGRGPQAGAINAALFLEDFIPATQDWLHVDLYAWNDSSRPGRPAGGEAQTLRTLLAYLERRYARA